MKKNLFLLFSFYFFVLQSIFIWFLWHEPKFYWLALINCVFIVLIAVFSKENNSNNNDSSYGRNEQVMNTNSEFKIHHFWIFLISFLFWVLVVLWLKDVVLYLRVLAWIAWAILVFMIWWLIFNYKSLRVREWKFYLILLVLALIWSIIKLINIDFSSFKFVSDDEFTQLSWDVFEENNLVPEENIIENENLSGNDVIENNTGDVLTWVNEENTGDIAEDIVENQNLDALATYLDVIKYLLKDEKLSTKINLTFNYMKKTDPDYAYFKTAHEKRLIWTDTNPNQTPSCETFVVMKWLIEEWNVWSYTNIKQAYWDYAKNHGKLPTCEYWKYVKIWDLK